MLCIGGKWNYFIYSTLGDWCNLDFIAFVNEVVYGVYYLEQNKGNRKYRYSFFIHIIITILIIASIIYFIAT